MRAARASRSASGCSGVRRVSTRRMAARSGGPAGGGTYRRLSKRPGRSSAASTRSGRLVAATTTTSPRACTCSTMALRAHSTVSVSGKQAGTHASTKGQDSRARRKPAESKSASPQPLKPKAECCVSAVCE